MLLDHEVITQWRAQQHIFEVSSCIYPIKKSLSNNRVEERETKVLYTWHHITADFIRYLLKSPFYIFKELGKLFSTLLINKIPRLK